MDEKIIEEWLKNSSSSGEGFGRGEGYGYGEGYDFGYGDGDGRGYGEGCGDGRGIKYFNKERVWQIDSMPTIIKQIHGNIAKGFILNQDFTLEKTYIAKGHNYFAHGTTIQEAIQILEEKIFDAMDIEEKIIEFKNKFDRNKKYSGHEFFTWHHNLTGSCLQGRNSFVENNNIDLDKMYSVSEFLQIVKGAYGWGALKQLEEDYK